MPAGYVNWVQLLQPLTDELGIDIKRERDLVTLAQYYFNYAGGRGEINQLILDEIGVSKEPTENHQLLARLPISTYWTINYDDLIEKSLKQIRKNPDVKYDPQQLATTRPRRDAVVYKMHGDVERPDQAVIIRNDYERYPDEREAFITALSGDLVSKTFLFLGLSFSDPNVNQVFSRVRRNFNENRREHYALMRRYTKSKNEAEEDFQHNSVMQKLFIEDLRRYGIKVVLVDEYEEITEILRAIERGYRGNSIWISGSAEDFSPWTPREVEDFASKLASLLIHNDFRLVSGFGLGIGNHIVTGAMSEVFASKGGKIEEYIQMRPFPNVNSTQTPSAELLTAYREEMASNAGIAIFMFGNKLVDGQFVNADGVIQEFEIAHKAGLHLLPIGGTGSAAKVLYDLMEQELSQHYPQASERFLDDFKVLGEQKENLMEYLEPLIGLIRQLKGED